MGFKGLQLVLRLRRRRPAPRVAGAPAADRRRRKREIELRLAQTAEELETAYALVQSQYLRRGYAKPGGAVRFVSHCCIPTTHTLVAQVRGVVIATASVIVDGPLGLPLESTYPAEVQALREAGERLAEISCLATRRRGDARAAGSLSRNLCASALPLRRGSSLHHSAPAPTPVLSAGALVRPARPAARLCRLQPSPRGSVGARPRRRQAALPTNPRLGMVSAIFSRPRRSK